MKFKVLLLIFGLGIIHSMNAQIKDKAIRRIELTPQTKLANKSGPPAEVGKSTGTKTSTGNMTGEQTNATPKLPPIITISSPLNGSTVENDIVEIQYSLKSDDSPIQNIKAFVNGSPAVILRGASVTANNNNSLAIKIPQTDCIISLEAENEYGKSSSSEIAIKYKGEGDGNEPIIRKPKLYVLAIGISEYQNQDYRLNFAAIDAKGFINVLKQQKTGFYDTVIVNSFLDLKATRENIQDGLEWIQDQTSQRDIAMIFYAGHGANDNNGHFYLIPVAGNAKKLKSTCVNFEDLKANCEFYCR
jgi:hypothetical protein